MNIYIKSFLILLCIGITSCEDVIEIEVPTAKARLVIEASLDWQKGTTGNNQTIKLSTSNPYFEKAASRIVTGASVKVTNNNSNAEYVFVDQNDGTYTINNFVPVINDRFTLEVVYNSETYKAIETLKSVSPIKRVEKSLDGGLYDNIEGVSIFWDDLSDVENFYLIKVIDKFEILPNFEGFSDEFVNGNELDAFFEGEYEQGDEVEFTLYGISKQYNDYMILLIQQYYSAGDPFSPVPVKLKGNCINQDAQENYAFGYFRLTEFDKVTYTHQ